ncbi:hypothetical protein FQA47_007618 [Oryzias melastigma]|uniref:Uncharacterized protein n=1 Tax=Oryzias melastigma TaxID=30732 RepID=A0A834F5N3_ORYME|nr:hypothetical protein FQA47_007618 [Oryzias melastigma]
MFPSIHAHESSGHAYMHQVEISRVVWLKPVSVVGVQRRMNMVWLFFIIAVAAGFPCLDGAAFPDLTCTVTKMNDGYFMYQISGKPSSIKHNSSWEENNGIVIVAINSRYNESVVKTVKNDSVELYVCEDFLRYNMHFKKDGRHSKLTATCEANCTHLMTKDPPQVDDLKEQILKILKMSSRLLSLLVTENQEVPELLPAAPALQ